MKIRPEFLILIVAALCVLASVVGRVGWFPSSKPSDPPASSVETSQEDTSVGEFLALSSELQVQYLNEFLTELDAENDFKHMDVRGIWALRRCLQQAAQDSSSEAWSTLETGLRLADETDPFEIALFTMERPDDIWEVDLIRLLLDRSPNSSVARLNRFLSEAQRGALIESGGSEDDGALRSILGEATLLFNAIALAPALPLGERERPLDDFLSVFHAHFEPRKGSPGIVVLNELLAKRIPDGMTRADYVRFAFLYSLGDKGSRALEPDLLLDFEEEVTKLIQAERAIPIRFGPGWESPIRTDVDATKSELRAMKADLKNQLEEHLVELLSTGDPGSEVAERLYVRAMESGTAGQNDLPRLELAARAGNAEAAFWLGARLSQGGDEMESTRWLRIAAQRGNADAMVLVARAYKAGVGGPVNQVEAATWFRRAAYRGDVEAMVEYADACSKGEGVRQNQSEASLWYERAAKLGH